MTDNTIRWRLPSIKLREHEYYEWSCFYQAKLLELREEEAARKQDEELRKWLTNKEYDELLYERHAQVHERKPKQKKTRTIRKQHEKVKQENKRSINYQLLLERSDVRL